MNKRRFSENQIAAILKQHEAGSSVTELSRAHHVSEPTIYTWRTRFSGMNASEIRLQALELENRRLKRLVAGLTYEKDALKGIVRRNRVSAPV